MDTRETISQDYLRGMSIQIDAFRRALALTGPVIPVALAVHVSRVDEMPERPRGEVHGSAHPV